MPFCATLTVAFVALVIPFDRSEGLQGQICSLFLSAKGVTAWVRVGSKTKLPRRHRVRTERSNAIPAMIPARTGVTRHEVKQ